MDTTPERRRPTAPAALALAAVLLPAPVGSTAAGPATAPSSVAPAGHAAPDAGSADSSRSHDDHHAEASSSRSVGTAAAGDDDPADFAFLSRTDPPARWDPCDPVDWRLRTTGAPRDGYNVVVEAVRKVEAATGLRFRYLGESTFVPTQTQRTEPGVDLSIAWVEEDAADVWGSATPPAGVGGASWSSGSVDPEGRAVPRIRSGFVALEATSERRDDAWLEAITATPAGRDPEAQAARVLASRRQVVLHEVGHAVGLSHSTGSSQVMAPLATGVTAWAAGDRAGLARLGAAAGCLAPTQAEAQAARVPEPLPGPELLPWSGPETTQAAAPSGAPGHPPAGPTTATSAPSVAALAVPLPLVLPTLLPDAPATTPTTAPGMPPVPAAVPAAAPGPVPAAVPTAARPVRVWATGPARVRRGAPAVLTVRGRPGDALTLHVRRTGVTSFTAVGSGRLDARGVGRVVFRPRVDHRWYVAVGPARTRTAVGLVRIAR